MTGLAQDLRYGLRQLRKYPGFTVTGVFTLALGIGVNTVMFSIVNAVLLRPLPFREPSRLMLVHEGIPTLGFSKIGFSAPDLSLYQQSQKSFQGMAPYQNESFELSGRGEPERITAARVSANLFSVLGIEPELGRTFSAAEDRPGVAVAVLSYGLWQDKYAGSRAVIGHTITLDRIPYTVLGVMPQSFRFPQPGTSSNNQPAALWVPIAFTPSELEGWGDMYNSDVVARLRPGVTLAQARSEAEGLAQRIIQAYPPALLKVFSNATLTATVDPLHSEVFGSVRPLVLLLQGAVGLVLLIACTNVALLLLSRAAARSREIAIRMSMGAARSRLIGQLLAESFLLAAISGASGLALAAWFKGLLLAKVPSAVGLPGQTALDARVLLLTVSITALTALLFGLAPALHATRGGLRGGIQEVGRGGTPGRERRRMQATLVIVEFGLAIILMVGAALLFRSFVKLLAVNPGFQADRVLAMSISLPEQAYPHAPEIRNYYQQAIALVDHLPGVTSAAAANDLPLNGTELDAIEVENGDRGTTPAVRQTWVLGDYMESIGIPLLRGRLFTASDRQRTQPVIIISASLANRLWPHQDALGKRIHRGGADAPWRTVVGIVGDVPDTALWDEPQPHCYSPLAQEPDDYVERGLRTLNLAIRTSGNPAAIASSVLKQLRRLDPALAISDVRTMTREVKDSIAAQRFNAMLVGIYAGLALLLAMIGIYGVIAYMVMQQTHEIGIRMALGAQKRDVVGLVLRHGMRLIAAGAMAGLLGALAVTRLMNSLLYGVTPHDPVAFIGASGFLVVAAALACLVPAIHAAKVDPMVALRYE